MRVAMGRFLAVVTKTEDCWYLEGASRDNGYGMFTASGVRFSGHRFAYTAFVGPIPRGYEIDHLCRDRACVRPEHLELVTRQENLSRRDAIGPPLMHLPVVERLIARRLVTESGCWLWLGAKVRGYGVVSVMKRTQYVHRLAYEAMVEPIPEGMTIDHVCRVAACFNPAHLEVVTRAENARRMPREGKRRRTCRAGHLRDEVGTNRKSFCAACWPDRVPRPRRADVNVRCAQGHAYAEVGRYPSGGCVACQAVKDAVRRKGPRPLAQSACADMT